MTGRIEPLRKTTLVEMILERLRDDILEGRYRPGASLPPERELAERYGVNRTSVKHALMKLESAGLIDIRHGIGSRVLDYGRTGGAELLQHLLVRAGALDAGILGDLLELRVFAGGSIARIAARRADAGSLERLRGHVEAIADAGDDPARVQALDLAFFEELTEATGNRALRMVMNSVAATYGQVPEAFVHAYDDTAAVLDGLQEILEAVESKDEERARAATERHLEANTAAMIAGLDPAIAGEETS